MTEKICTLNIKSSISLLKLPLIFFKNFLILIIFFS